MMQKNEIVSKLLAKYQRSTPINKKGLEHLYKIAESRGYQPTDIQEGLDICIRKNYLRSQYIPPNNDPMQEVIHERKYIEDWEFRQIFKTFR